MIVKIGLQPFFLVLYNWLFAIFQLASKVSTIPIFTLNIAQSDKFLQQIKTEYS